MLLAAAKIQALILNSLRVFGTGDFCEVKETSKQHHPSAQSPGAAVLPPRSSYSLSQRLVLLSSFPLEKLLLTPAPLAFTTGVCCLMCCSNLFSRQDLSKQGNVISVALYSLALLFPVSSIIVHFCQKEIQTQGAK